MTIFFLKNLTDGHIDGVIIAQESIKQDIIQALQKAKENPECTWDDLSKALPKDCSLYHSKDIVIDNIYYQ